MKFVMMRNRTLCSLLGHSIGFVKGVPTFVPPEMYEEVLAAGGVPESEIPEAELPQKSKEPTAADERLSELFMAFEVIATRNNSDDFTAGGVPNNKAIDRELGWVPPAKERDLSWAKYKTKED